MIKCRFCEEQAVGVFILDKGCACYPNDKEQALCEQHISKATPIGNMILKETVNGYEINQTAK